VAGRDSGLCTEPHIACYVINQPTYSPDVAPNDLWLFPAPKLDLKWIYFTTIEDMKSNATPKLRKVTKKKLSNCTSSNGRIHGASVCPHGPYCEGDYVAFPVYSTITVQFNYSGNFLTAPPMHIKRV
jgi:hypothetical protein